MWYRVCMKTIFFFILWLGGWGFLCAVSGSRLVPQLASILGTLLCFWKFCAVYKRYRSAIARGRRSPSRGRLVGLFIMALLFCLLTVFVCSKAVGESEIRLYGGDVSFFAFHGLLLWLCVYCIIRGQNRALQIVGILGILFTVGLVYLLSIAGHAITNCALAIGVAYLFLVLAVGGASGLALRQQRRLSKRW
jgi:hypothetical protein